jgi:hypothetical protein
VGVGFKNLYSVASEEKAKAKLDQLRESARPITVAEFLGDKLNCVELISFTESSPDAVALLRDLLDSIIVSPGHRFSGPGLAGPAWSEMSCIKVRALLHFENGRFLAGKTSAD